MTFRFILLILICFSSISASAQIFDKITRTVEQAINNEINRVGDKVAERLVEKLIESVFAGQEAPTDSLGMYQVGICIFLKKGLFLWSKCHL